MAARCGEEDALRLEIRAVTLVYLIGGSAHGEVVPCRADAAAVVVHAGNSSQVYYRKVRKDRTGREYHVAVIGVQVAQDQPGTQPPPPL